MHNKLKYGTSGFRFKEKLLITNVVPKLMQVIEILCDLSDQNTLGIMITASHNTFEFNGIKIVDQQGKMLDSCYEEVVEDIVNEKYHKNCNEYKSLTCILGYDTRPSSLIIRDMLIENSINTRIHIIDLGYMTTPELHYMTYSRTQIFLKDYVSNITSLPQFPEIITQAKKWIIDCANGVGAITLQKFDYNFNLINTNINNPLLLNYLCGAEHVQHSKPSNIINPYDTLLFCLDGDADRLILVTKDNYVINGDKIGCFLAKFLIDTFSIPDYYKLGFIHTAYTNDSAVDFCSKLGYQTVLTETGIKNLINATKDFDIAVYFEPNGHGGIYFNEQATLFFERKSLETNTFITLCNQLIGDGIYLIFLLAYVTLISDIDLNLIYNMYKDLPNILVSYDNNNSLLLDQNVLKSLQIKAKNLQVKLHIRNSGTEPIIRVYVEGNNFMEIYNEISEISNQK